VQWILSGLKIQGIQRSSQVDMLKRRVAELERQLADK
jgi:hypothetical protein